MLLFKSPVASSSSFVRCGRCSLIIKQRRRAPLSLPTSTSRACVLDGAKHHTYTTMTSSPQQTHHKVVALETFFCPGLVPLDLPAPHTYEMTEYLRTKPEEIPERIRDADIVTMTTIPLQADVLSEAVSPRLKMIAVVASGTDSVDLAACRARGIHVANTPHCNATAVADHAIASYFAARRAIPLTHGLVRAGEMPRRPLFKLLDGPDGRAPRTSGREVVGIMGYGAIGRQIEARARALGMRVLISGRKGTASASAGRTDFGTVLREASVIVVCLPRVPETENLISTAELEAMRSHALVINVSRGGVVDEDALVEALKARRIAGASTDVYLREPASPENSRLLAPDTAELNLVLTPHSAWYAEDTNDNYMRCLKENVSNWLLGKPTNKVV